MNKLITLEEQLRICVGSIAFGQLASLVGNSGQVGVTERHIWRSSILTLDITGNHRYPFLSENFI
jgi:hypothetical protein